MLAQVRRETFGNPLVSVECVAGHPPEAPVLDVLTDGIVDNLAACTAPLVEAQLAKIQCSSAKSATWLTGDQIATLEKAFAGPVDSTGKQLYSDWPWDAVTSRHRRSNDRLSFTLRDQARSGSDVRCV